MNARQSMIARIHIAREKALRCTSCGRMFFEVSGRCPRCGETGERLPDWFYRQILLSSGGEDSCRRLDDKALVKVMEVFDEAGFARCFPHVSPAKEERKARIALQNIIRKRAREVLGNNWEARLQGFLDKSIGRSALSFCSMEELRNVIGWINRAEKYAHKENQYG